MSHDLDARAKLHLRVGWWALLTFATLGVALELFHALKLGWYLDLDHEVRRLMWTLAHAHGVLLALVHVAFAVTIHLLDINTSAPATRLASRMLLAALLLLPGGFWLGGFAIQGGDPGPGVALVPLGALALLGALGVIAREAQRA